MLIDFKKSQKLHHRIIQKKILNMIEKYIEKSEQRQKIIDDLRLI